MHRRNLFIFVVTHVKELGGNGRGVIIVRHTTIEEITSQFDAFLAEAEVAKLVQFAKTTDEAHPGMVIYRGPGEEHIVIGRSEVGWKGDYGLTHTDLVVSIH